MAEPLKIRVFDPNPLIGDPYYDLAGILTRLDFHRVKAKADDSDDPNPPWLQRSQRFVDTLINTYIKGSGQELDQQRLLANLIGTAIPKNLYYEKNNSNNFKEIELRRGLLKNYISQFTK